MAIIVNVRIKIEGKVPYGTFVKQLSSINGTNHTTSSRFNFFMEMT